MVKNTELSCTINPPSFKNERLAQKPFKVMENIFQNNTNSNYTERIHELEKNFVYSSNSDSYWSEPEQSILYGTPLYEAASSSQKIALNHLYWAIQYSKVPADEATTIIFNQITGSVFSNLGGFGTLCQELELETSQEHYHIHAFQRISRLTKKALLCNKLKQSYLPKIKFNDRLKSLPNLNFLTESLKIPDFLERSSYSTLRFINRFMLESQGQKPGKYLQELENKNEFIQVPTDGIFSKFPFRRQTVQLLTFNFGTSPFLASHYYALRLIANMMLKNWEYNYAKYFRTLEKNAEFIPAPTSVSYFHFLDESFHTTISKTIAQDLYKVFSKPTAYELTIANMTLYLMQLNLKGLSGAIPYRFIQDDLSFMGFFYQLLQTPIFDLSASEALYWLEKCFCQEHEGFHLTFNHHQRLLSNLCQTFVDVEYFWPINREMRLMASGDNIGKSVQSNIKTFKRFSQSLAYL
ncbi:hypothetical protein A6S26_17125 [Nostoc sp. ATCC 43529]|nr:hypothetical protein A6S26_17125 [Nostoc sp. ATCC 43529]